MADALEFLRGTEEVSPKAPAGTGGRVGRAREFLGAFPEGPLGPGKGTELNLLELEAQGVDIESGAGTAGARARISLASPERRQQILEQTFPKGFRETDAGTVVTVEQDGALREVLLDESGLTLNDFADAAGGTVEAGAAVAGVMGALAIGGPVLTSLPVLALIAGVSGQLGGGIAETLADMKAGGIDVENPEDVAMLENMVKRRSLNAAIDSTLDLVSGGLFKTAGVVGQAAAGPFARTMAQSPQKEIREAASELGVDLTPGQRTGVPALMKAEALQSKVPGSAGVVKQSTIRAEEQMAEARTRITEGAESSAVVGKQMAGEVQGAQASRAESVESLNRVAETTIQREFNQLANTASRRRLSRSESGELGRRGLQRQRIVFRKKQTALENDAQGMIDALPEGQRAFAKTDIAKQTAAELREEFPKQTIVEKIVSQDFSGTNALRKRIGLEPLKEQTTDVEIRKIIPEFFPPAAKRVLAGIEKLDPTVTVDELRKSRQVVANLINDADALPGLSTGLLKKLESSLTQQIRAAVADAPTEEIGDALTVATNHYRRENTKFRNQVVTRAMRNEGQPGFMESKDLLPGLLLKGRVEDARRLIDVLGENHPAVKTARRAVIDDMFAGSRNSLVPGGFAVDPKQLRARFDGLDPEVRKLVFGADEKKAQALVQSLAARHGLIDVGRVNRLPGDEDLINVLQQAQAEAESAKQIFDRKVFKPLLQEGGSISEEQFVRHVMKTGDLTDIRRFFEVVSPEVGEKMRKRTILELLSSASKASPDAEQQLQFLTRDVIPAGENLGKVLAQGFGVTPEESTARIRAILGDEGFRVIRQLATVEAARLRSDQAGKAVGGLVGGTILKNLMTLNPQAAVSIAGFRVVAGLLAFPPTRLWLASPILLPKPGNTAKAFQIALPQILDVASQELGEGSEDFAKVKDFFEKDVPKMIGIE